MAHGMNLIVFSVISLVTGREVVNTPEMECYENICWKDSSYPKDEINKEILSSEIYEMLDIWNLRIVVWKTYSLYTV
ncbi:hypothetical protein JTB14_025792 [Gonioctena quinquepunctata]|nr:hypothetical protein JTB14_025792 [Gonioctena quinquepunctata]